MKRSGVADLPLHGGACRRGWPPHGHARHGHRRERALPLRPAGVPVAPERSVLVPGPGLGDGHGLALIGHHHVGDGRLEEGPQPEGARARHPYLRWTRPPLAQTPQELRRDRRPARPRWRRAGAHQPPDRSRRQQRHRRRLSDLSAHVRADCRRRVGDRAAGHEREEPAGAALSLALGGRPRLHRRSPHGDRRRARRHDHEPGRSGGAAGAGRPARNRARPIRRRRWRRRAGW